MLYIRRQSNTFIRKQKIQRIDLKAASLIERTEEKPSSSEMSPEEVAEFVPVQNHVAAHVLEMQEVQEGPAKAVTHVLDNENFQAPEETHQTFMHCMVMYLSIEGKRNKFQ